jgi:hypothetical protein
LGDLVERLWIFGGSLWESQRIGAIANDFTRAQLFCDATPLLSAVRLTATAENL